MNLGNVYIIFLYIVYDYKAQNEIMNENIYIYIYFQRMKTLCSPAEDLRKLNIPKGVLASSTFETFTDLQTLRQRSPVDV